MNKPPYVNLSHQRSLDTHGQTVRLYNYESDDSERVQTWNETDASPHTIQARITPRDSPRTARDVRETGDVDIDASILIKDDADGADSIRDGGGEGASVIDPDEDGVNSDGTDWRVLVKHDQDNGHVRLDVERMD